MRRASAWAAMLAVWMMASGTVLSLAGCNTLKGVGQDLQSAGEAVEDAFD